MRTDFILTMIGAHSAGKLWAAMYAIGVAQGLGYLGAGAATVHRFFGWTFNGGLLAYFGYGAYRQIDGPRRNFVEGKKWLAEMAPAEPGSGPAADDPSAVGTRFLEAVENQNAQLQSLIADSVLSEMREAERVLKERLAVCAGAPCVEIQRALDELEKIKDQYPSER